MTTITDNGKVIILTGTNEILYSHAYNFHFANVPNANHESAHEAGMKKLKSLKRTIKIVTSENFKY